MKFFHLDDLTVVCFTLEGRGDVSMELDGKKWKKETILFVNKQKRRLFHPFEASIAIGSTGKIHRAC